jgi:hypothetical protein
MKELATVQSYGELITALRARADELKISRITIDSVTGLPGGYSSKLLASVPIRTLGRASFGPMLQALGLRLIVIEDPESLERFADQRDQRERAMPAAGTDEVLRFEITRRKLGMLARRGGEERAAKMTPKQRQMSARKASRARWRRHRQLAASP